MIENKLYDAPFAQIVVFPEQDVLTSSGGKDGDLELPDHDW